MLYYFYFYTAVIFSLILLRIDDIALGFIATLLTFPIFIYLIENTN
jgi:ABC-type Fe3+-siderophore transport system permease subunit